MGESPADVLPLAPWLLKTESIFRLVLSEQVGTGEIDDLVSPSVQNRLDHVEVEIDDIGDSREGHPPSSHNTEDLGYASQCHYRSRLCITVPLLRFTGSPPCTRAPQSPNNKHWLKKEPNHACMITAQHKCISVMDVL